MGILRHAFVITQEQRQNIYAATDTSALQCFKIISTIRIYICLTLELSEQVKPNVDTGNLGVVALSPEYVSLHV